MSYEVPRSAYRGLACIKCGETPNQLMKCSRCKRVGYCDENCQKADYRDHMHFCRAWVILREKETPVVNAGCDPGCDTYRAFVDKRIRRTFQELTSLLGRVPYKDEQRLVVFEPRCAVCFRTNYDLEQNPDRPGQQLACCTNCFAIYACSHEHAVFIKNKHAIEPYEPGGRLTRCKLHQLVTIDDDEETTYCRDFVKPVWFPDRILLSYTSLSMYPYVDAWVKWFSLPETQWPRDTINLLELRTASAHLSFPMTILYGMEMFDHPSTRILLENFPGSSAAAPVYQPLRSRARLEVHVIGLRGNHLAAKQALVFEELQHLLPACKQLVVRFIGPDLINYPTLCYEVPLGHDDMGYGCTVCRANGLIRIQSMHPHVYHEWVQERRQTNCNATQWVVPDLVVCFNSGMTECDENTTRWIPTIRLLLEARIPTIVTDMSRNEAQGSVTLIKEIGGLIAWEPRRNPWRNEQGIPEFTGNDEFYFPNNYVFGFCGRKAD